MAAPIRLGARHVRANISHVLRRAQAGEQIVVTVDGHPVAAIVPLPLPADGAPSIDDLTSRGLLLPPRRDDAFRPLDPVPTWRGSRLDRLLDELR